MSALRFVAAAAKRTPRLAPCPKYQLVEEKVEGLKAAHGQVGSLSKSIQGLETSAKRYSVVWRFNERKIEHGLEREEPDARRSYHLALGFAAAVMYFGPKTSKMFT